MIKVLQEVLNTNNSFGHYPWFMTRINANTMVKHYAK